MQEILTIQAELELTNPIQIADVCDAIIEQMKGLKENALQEESFKKQGNLETADDELVGDWAIEPRRKARR